MRLIGRDEAARKRRPGNVRNRVAKLIITEEMRHRIELGAMRSYMNFGGGNDVFANAVRHNDMRNTGRP